MFEILPPPLIDVQQQLLDSSEFKEDSVREEIIYPILRALRYSANKPNQIIRSRGLTHPFVYIGSIKRPVTIIPDYLIEIEEKPVFVLDAKAPDEDILEGKNVEQAYSYAIHKEVRCKKYGLCNGKLLTVFSIDEYKPIEVFDLREISSNWSQLYKTLSPLAFKRPHIFDFHLDLGLSLLKSGVDHSTHLHFFGFPVDHFIRVDDSTYSTMKNTTIDGIEYAVSYDFTWPVLHSIVKELPQKAQIDILNPLIRQPYKSFFPDHMFFVNIIAYLSEEVETNEDESYVPLKVLGAKLSSDVTAFIARNPNGRPPDSGF